MIKTEKLTIKGWAFVRTYSDSGYMIERDGVLYSEAYDPAEFGRTYTETDIPDEGDEITDSEALDIIVNGGNNNA